MYIYIVYINVYYINYMTKHARLSVFVIVCVCVRQSVCLHSVSCFHSAFNIFERAASIAARPILWFKIDSVQTLSLANVAQLHVFHRRYAASNIIKPCWKLGQHTWSPWLAACRAHDLCGTKVWTVWANFTTKCHKVIRDSAVICPAESQKACVGTASSPVKRVKKSEAKVWQFPPRTWRMNSSTHDSCVSSGPLSLSLAILESSTEAYSLSAPRYCQATSSFLVLGVLGGVVQKVL